MGLNISLAEARKLGYIPKIPIQTQKTSAWEETFESLWMRFGNGWIPEREYKFIEGRRFRADFAWPSKKLAVEIDGCLWVKGGHNSGKGKQRDAERDRLAVLSGWRILRYTSDDLTKRPIQCVEEVIQALTNRRRP